MLDKARDKREEILTHETMTQSEDTGVLKIEVQTLQHQLSELSNQI